MPPENEHETNEMFPTIGSDEQDAAAEGEGNEQEEYLPGYKTREEAEKAMGDLNSRVSEFEKELGAARERETTMQNMLDQVISNQPAASRDTPPASGDLDFSTLPDPVEDRDGFMRGLQSQVEKIVETRDTAASQRMTHAQRLDELWNEFQTEHAELADFPEIVEAAAKQEVNRATARGLSAEKAIFSNPDNFKRRVAQTAQSRVDAMRQKFGGSDAGDGDGDGDGGNKRDQSRTGGVAGGSMSSPPGGGGGGDEGQQHGSLVGDIKKIQSESGFI